MTKTTVESGAPRICWLTTEFFPPETGGTGMVAGRLSQGLSERGLDIRILTRQTLPPCPSRELVGKVRVRRLDPPGGAKGAGWRALPLMLGFMARLSLALIAEAREYDIVVVSGMKSIPMIAVPLCRLLRKKCLVRIESPFELVEPISSESLVLMKGVSGRIMSVILRKLQRTVLRRADCVIAISDDIVSRVRSLERVPPRIAKIPNGVDMEKFAPVPPDEKARLRGRLKFPPGRKVVVYVGRLSLAKGVMMLVQAWPALSARFPEAYLMMVGTGSGSWDDCEADIVEYVRGHCPDSVTLAGHSAQVPDYLRAADLFVNPSDYEGFSLTLVEALGCALPVVTTAVGVAPEVIRDGLNGFVCPPKNKEALTAALAMALGASDRWASMGRLARESVKDFDIPVVIDQYLRLVRELQAPRV